MLRYKSPDILKQGPWHTKLGKLPGTWMEMTQIIFEIEGNVMKTHSDGWVRQGDKRSHCQILLTETINEELENEGLTRTCAKKEPQPTHVQSAIHIITALKKIASVTLLSEYYVDIYRFTYFSSELSWCLHYCFKCHSSGKKHTKEGLHDKKKKKTIGIGNASKYLKGF